MFHYSYWVGDHQLETYTGIKYMYRKDPVPGKGKRNISGSCFTHPKTHNEETQNAVFLKDEYKEKYNIRVRAKRCCPNIPNHFDDISKQYLGDRCWKRRRKKQFKN